MLVECGPHDANSVYTDDPVVIVEVLSSSTRRIDEREKKEAYLTLPSLAAYVLVDSERLGVVVWRRAGETFEREAYGDVSGVVKFPEIGVELAVSEVYERVEWGKERQEELS